VEYLVVGAREGELEGQMFLLAASRLAAYARELGEEPQVIARLRGSELEGLRYHPPFPFFAEHDGAFRILTGDFVTTEDGTGLVHLAPAFGEDDMTVCAEAGIDPVVPVDDAGKFTTEVPAYAGQQVFDANKPIIADLKAGTGDRKSTRLNSSHVKISYAVFCLKKNNCSH